MYSEGLKTTVFPVKRAGTMWLAGVWAGKLNGPMTASTPRGRYRHCPSTRGATFTEKSRMNLSPSPTISSILAARRSTSRRDSVNGLPASWATSRMRDSCRETRTLLRSSSLLILAFKGCLLHPGKARTAAFTAESTPSAETISLPTGTSKSPGSSLISSTPLWGRAHRPWR